MSVNQTTAGPDDSPLLDRSRSRPHGHHGHAGRTWLTCLGLTLAIAAIYGQTLNFKFVNFDDDVHVTENTSVNTGLTLSNLAWDFGIHGPSQWHPLAWLSHQLDCEWYGLSSGGHHATSVALHLTGAIVLFLTLQRLLNAWGTAAFTATAFAVHPLNVESVAWVSERRNVLCGVFCMLTIWAYIAYSRHRTAAHYCLVVLGHAAALMSKPLAVTLPCVLLLIDYCNPRLRDEGHETPLSRGDNWRLICEKIPLFAMSIGASILTIWCQQAVGTVATFAAISLPLRVANAFWAYGWYVWKLIWPFGLGVFYPHPALVDAQPWSRLAIPAAISAVVLLIISIVAIRLYRRAPWFLFGWLWFLGVMVPMIGIIQVGDQQQADRYSYLPSIGIFLILGCAGSTLAQVSREWKTIVRIVSVLAITGWSVAATYQASYWRDSVSLFSHTLEVTERNHLAHNNLGFAFLKQGKLPAAVRQFSLAIQAVPNYALAHYNLGVAFDEQGHADAARRELETSLRLNARNAQAHQRLASVLMRSGEYSAAITHFRNAVQLAPDDGITCFNLGLALAKSQQTEEAIYWLKIAHHLQPTHQETILGLALALRQSGQQPEAIAVLQQFLEQNPDSAGVENLLRDLMQRD